MMMIAFFLGLLALTAFFNLAEMALVASHSAALERTDGARAQAVLALKRRPGLFLAAIRAGDLVTDLLMGAFVVTWLEAAFRSALSGWHILGPSVPMLSAVAAFGLVSYLVLVFADLVPKSVALAAPERHAMAVAAPLRLFILIARPLFAALDVSNSVVLRLLGVQRGSEERITQEEIRRALSEGLNAGAILSFERSMMERVLDLDHRSVRTVMMGRRYIQSLRADMSADEIRRAVLAATASRLPVSSGSDPDAMIGSVSRGEVLARIVCGEAVDLAGMVTAPIYVAENASVLSVLETLKDAPGGMVMVLDEFGSLVGIATLADVLEAVAGDVSESEHAAGRLPGEDIEGLSDGSFVVSGTQPVDDLMDILPSALPVVRHYKTVAGLVLDHLRRIPAEGEVIELPGLSIEVVRVDRGTVVTLRLVPKP